MEHQSGNHAGVDFRKDSFHTGNVLFALKGNHIDHLLRKLFNDEICVLDKDCSGGNITHRYGKRCSGRYRDQRVCTYILIYICCNNRIIHLGSTDVLAVQFKHQCCCASRGSRHICVKLEFYRHRLIAPVCDCKQPTSLDVIEPSTLTSASARLYASATKRNILIGCHRLSSYINNIKHNTSPFTKIGASSTAHPSDLQDYFVAMDSSNMLIIRF
nr:MAG TPA: hypothetical protein [Caudoviricetes sp.]